MEVHGEALNGEHIYIQRKDGTKGEDAISFSPYTGRVRMRGQSN